MAEDRPTRKESEPPSFGQSAKRAAIGALFFLILLIPRIRRLRRRVRLWTALRVLAAIAGGGLLWESIQAERGAGWLVGAIVLIAFAQLTRATPVVKSLDEKARGLGALVVLNGGTFIPPLGVVATEAHIFAGPDQLIALDRQDGKLCGIPTAKVERCVARPIAASGDTPEEGKVWELEITWDDGSPQTTRFRFNGFFAEHLARVAEATVENLRRKELPVFPA